MTELLQRFTVPSVSNRLVRWVVMLNSTCRGRVRVWKRPELLGVCLKPKVTGPTLTVTVYEKTRQRRVRWKLVVMLYMRWAVKPNGSLGNRASGWGWLITGHQWNLKLDLKKKEGRLSSLIPVSIFVLLLPSKLVGRRCCDDTTLSPSYHLDTKSLNSSQDS